MALTKSNERNSALVNKRANFMDVDFDDSYPTGGESLTPGDFGLEVIEMMIIAPQDGYVFEYDYTNEKIKAMVPIDAGSSSAVAGANNTLVATTGAVEIAGTGNAFQQVGAEVTDTTDLSGVTGVKCFAIGY